MPKTWDAAALAAAAAVVGVLGVVEAAAGAPGSSQAQGYPHHDPTGSHLN